MLDITKQEIKVGDYIAYAKVNGRSAHMAIYHVREVTESTIKAHQLQREDDWHHEYRYKKYCSTANGFIPMDDKEKAKVDNKTVTLSMSSQAIILHGFDPVAHRFS